jgi:hypothetical protein
VRSALLQLARKVRKRIRQVVAGIPTSGRRHLVSISLSLRVSGADYGHPGCQRDEGKMRFKARGANSVPGRGGSAVLIRVGAACAVD